MTPLYSVVIPLKNESENIRDLILELESVMHQMQAPWELICIDDGSTDTTLPLLQLLSKERPYLKILSFNKNYGQSSAFDAGFRHAQGQFVITLDGDGQNDPHDIPKLIKGMHDYDLMCGVRVNRRDSFLKRLTSKIANAIRHSICQDNAKDTGCSLKVYRKECLDKIKMYEGMHRFFPALFKIEGFRVGQLPVNHRERWRGKSNYNFFNRSFNTLADLWAVNWMNKRQLRYEFKKDDSHYTNFRT